MAGGRMIIVKSDEVAIAQALAKLLDQLGSERLIRLSELIQDVEDKTGYGNVSIVINDRRVETIKQEFSYK